MKTAWNAASAACYARAACPTGAIYVEADENDPHNPLSPGERHAKVYEVNLLRCIFCGDCEEACPTEAIVLGHEFALADYERRDFILTKEEPQPDGAKRHYPPGVKTDVRLSCLLHRGSRRQPDIGPWAS